MVADLTEVMLATPSRDLGHDDPEGVVGLLTDAGGWFFELKWDGIRAVAHITEGSVRLTNRRQANITFRYPEVVDALGAAFAGRTLVLDGEIIVIKDGHPDFASAHRRDAQSSAGKARALSLSMPARYAPFDLLSLAGVDQRSKPYTERRGLLEAAQALLEGSEAYVPTLSGTNGRHLWEVVREHALEGLVAKRGTSTYQSRRSPDWVKVRANKRLSALVCGFDPGSGSRAATFGNLHLAVIDEKTSALRHIGKVGTGFSDRQLAAIKPHLYAGKPLIVDVEYLEVSPQGQLRFPVFKGLREDIGVLDCTTAQL